MTDDKYKLFCIHFTLSKLHPVCDLLVQFVMIYYSATYPRVFDLFV